jgi:hypothetical protein
LATIYSCRRVPALTVVGGKGGLALGDGGRVLGVLLDRASVIRVNVVEAGAGVAAVVEMLVVSVVLE